MRRFQHGVAILTGAASIGKEIAHTFAHEASWNQNMRQRLLYFSGAIIRPGMTLPASL